MGIYLCCCVLLLLYFIGAGELVELHHAKERVLSALGLSLLAQFVGHVQGQPARTETRGSDDVRPPGLMASHVDRRRAEGRKDAVV